MARFSATTGEGRIVINVSYSDTMVSQRHDPVHQIGVHLAPHPGVHAAHRAADDQTQMSDFETFGDQPIARLDHVIVPVVRKFPLSPVEVRT